MLHHLIFEELTMSTLTTLFDMSTNARKFVRFGAVLLPLWYAVMMLFPDICRWSSIALIPVHLAWAVKLTQEINFRTKKLPTQREVNQFTASALWITTMIPLAIARRLWIDLDPMYFIWIVLEGPICLGIVMSNFWESKHPRAMGIYGAILFTISNGLLFNAYVFFKGAFVFTPQGLWATSAMLGLTQYAICWKLFGHSTNRVWALSSFHAALASMLALFSANSLVYALTSWNEWWFFVTHGLLFATGVSFVYERIVHQDRFVTYRDILRMMLAGLLLGAPLALFDDYVRYSTQLIAFLFAAMSCGIGWSMESTRQRIITALIGSAVFALGFTVPNGLLYVYSPYSGFDLFEIQRTLGVFVSAWFMHFVIGAAGWLFTRIDL